MASSNNIYRTLEEKMSLEKEKVHFFFNENFVTIQLSTKLKVNTENPKLFFLSLGYVEVITKSKYLSHLIPQLITEHIVGIIWLEFGLLRLAFCRESWLAKLTLYHGHLWSQWGGRSNDGGGG